MNNETREKTTVRKDILEALDKIYPGNMIAMWNGVEVSYLEEVYEGLQAKLSEIEATAIEYERDWTGEDFECDDECEGCEECTGETGDANDDDEDVDDDDDDEDDEKADAGDELSEDDNLASSYHLFFLALQGEQFEYECQTEDIDEEGNSILLNGFGVMGCCVGVSLLAPYAIVTPAFMETYEDNSYAYPDIDLDYIGPNKKADNLEDFINTNFTDLIEKEDIQVLKDVMDQATSILASFGISLLPAEEADKPVPWLKPAEDVFIEVPEDDSITLKEALFYHGAF